MRSSIVGGPELRLVTSSYDTYHRGLVELLSTSIRSGCCIYISANQPCNSVVKKLLEEDDDIDMENMVCIDLVSEDKAHSHPGRIHVSSPSALTELSIALDEGIHRFADDPSGCRVILDSVSTLAIYCQESFVARFIHTTLTKLRLRQIGGVFIVVNKDSHRPLLSKIVPFFDSVEHW